MPGGDNWPFETDSRSRRRRLEVQAFGACGVCGYVGAVGRGLSHYDERNRDRVRKRVCFGRPNLER
jgi:hypothetical protein